MSITYNMLEQIDIELNLLIQIEFKNPKWTLNSIEYYEIDGI